MGTNSLQQSLGGTTPEQWATDFLSLIGAPVTPTNVGTIVKWEYGESGGGGGMFNPLNTTQGGYGGRSINGPGVKDYPDYVAGLNATVQAFMSGLSKYGYGNILNGLKQQDQSATFAAIDASPWGTKDLPTGGSEAGSTFVSSPGVVRPTASLQDALAAQGSTDTSATAAAGGSDCLVRLPGITMPSIIPNIGGGCLLSRSQGRALLGAVSIIGGIALMMAGVTFLLLATKAGNQAVQSAAPLIVAAAA